MHRHAGEDQANNCQRSEEHTSELQSLRHLGCRLLLGKKESAASYPGGRVTAECVARGQPSLPPDVPPPLARDTAPPNPPSSTLFVLFLFFFLNGPPPTPFSPPPPHAPLPI